MSKVKLLAFAAFAVFVLSAPATAFAKEGGEWLVNGTRLPNGSKALLLPTVLVLNPGRLRIPGIGSIICNGEQIGVEEGKIIGPDGLLVKKLTFKECILEESENCTLENKAIETVPIHGLASLDLQGTPASLNAYILLLPETKNIFATIKFNGATCALLGIQAIKGDASLLVPGALHEVLLHLAIGFSLPKALAVGSQEALLEGLHFHIALLEHLVWGFH